MNFKGIVKAITPIQIITTRDNKQLRKLTIVCESEERYPQTLAFDVIGEDIEKDLPILADRIIVELNARATEYNGKWYNNLRAWKITKAQ